MGVEPTKLTAFTSGFSIRASTASLSPWTTLNTPSGRPASFRSLAINKEADGSVGLGLRIKVLPQAIATGNIHIGTMTGKLNGVMPATTPKGWRMTQLSISVDTCSVYSPLSNSGMPVANSTISIPRVTSPWASVNTLPCSAVMIAASASRLALSKSRYLNKIRARRNGLVWPQLSKAACATATAASTSLRLANATRRATTPLAGLYTSAKRPSLGFTSLPPTKWPISSFESKAWGAFIVSFINQFYGWLKPVELGLQVLVSGLFCFLSILSL